MNKTIFFIFFNLFIITISDISACWPAKNGKGEGQVNSHCECCGHVYLSKIQIETIQSYDCLGAYDEGINNLRPQRNAQAGIIIEPKALFADNDIKDFSTSITFVNDKEDDLRKNIVSDPLKEMMSRSLVIEELRGEEGDDCKDITFDPRMTPKEPEEP